VGPPKLPLVVFHKKLQKDRPKTRIITVRRRTSMRKITVMKMTWTQRGTPTMEISTTHKTTQTTQVSLRDRGDLEGIQALTERCLPIQDREDLRKIERVPERAENARKITYLV
jgi:hypothetical protein